MSTVGFGWRWIVNNKSNGKKNRRIDLDYSIICYLCIHILSDINKIK